MSMKYMANIHSSAEHVGATARLEDIHAEGYDRRTALVVLKENRKQSNRL